jgi:hypothetical protein
MSSSTERKVQGYLKPCSHIFFVKYVELYGMTESQAVNQAVKALQDTLPKEIKDRIVKGKNSY